MPRTGKRTNNKTISISVNPDVVALAKQAAKENGMTLSAFINQAMIDLVMFYVKLDGQKQKDAK